MRQETLSAWLSDRLSDYAAECSVPGAAAAIVTTEGCADAATGLLNLSTRVAATRDALFQIGSISKLFTATLVLQLVEQGRIGLQDPVIRHLPEFAVAAPEVTQSVTIRHLLTHTSGIDGDFFPETDSDSDCIDRYVSACAGLGQIHAPGASAAYCNAAPIILGAMLQRLTGQSWDALVAERILQPLGMAGTTTDYAELPRFRVAVGHLADAAGALQVAKRLHLPRGTGPTGGTLHCSAGDLARFGQAFAAGGAKLLRPETVAQATTRQAEWPTTPWTDIRIGLGWLLYDRGGRRIIGHDGATIGQAAFLRILPEAGLVAVLLTNGGQGKNLFRALFDDIFRRFAGIGLPAQPPAIERAASAADPMLGHYANALTEAEIALEQGELLLTTKLRGVLAGTLPGETWPLIPVGPWAFRIGNPAQHIQEIAVFDPAADALSLGTRTLTRQPR